MIYAHDELEANSWKINEDVSAQSAAEPYGACALFRKQLQARLQYSGKLARF